MNKNKRVYTNGKAKFIVSYAPHGKVSRHYGHTCYQYRYTLTPYWEDKPLTNLSRSLWSGYRVKWLLAEILSQFADGKGICPTCGKVTWYWGIKTEWGIDPWKLAYRDCLHCKMDNLIAIREQVKLSEYALGNL